MRGKDIMLFVVGLIVAGVATGAAADEPQSDPTRGQWDQFLDPLRDAEDRVAAEQKSVEDATGVHLGVGITKAWTWDFNDPPSGTPVPFHSLETHDSPSLDLAQIAASRPNQGLIPGFGLKLDFGKVARRVKADWDGDGRIDRGDTFETNNFDAQEAYLTWTVPDTASVAKGLNLKAGKWVTMMGAEVIEPWANYNYSRSLLFSFAIPFTHTGGLLTYPISDQLTASAGVVVGWDNVVDNNDAPSNHVGLTYTPSKMVSFTANGMYGPEHTDRTKPKRGIVDLVATVNATSALTFLLNYDWAHEDDAIGRSTHAEWQGFAGVANYAFTDRLSAALRGEWFQDHGGARTGLDQRLWETTATVKYLLTQHLYGRIEYRHDESSAKDAFPAGSPRFGKLLPGQDIAAVEVTYLFK